MVVAILAAILMIVAVRSVWRIQRELWRSDVVGGNQASGDETEWAAVECYRVRAWRVLLPGFLPEQPKLTRHT